MIEIESWVPKLVDAVVRTLQQRVQKPRATYRVQFNPQNLTFREAAALVPYLDELGVSHLYASPYRKARSGSPHGYAIVDYNSLNPELGTPEDYRAMVQGLREHKMGHILDIVPNHMSIEPGENRWWNDVLENGPSSPFASCFDVDWHPVKEELENKILLPMLGGPYGEVLEAGHLCVRYERGAFRLQVYDKTLPLDPKTWTDLLAHRREALRLSLPPESAELRELESVVTALEHLPDRSDTRPEQVAERQREKEVIKDRLARLSAASAEVTAFLERNLREFNGTPGEPHSFDRLDRLLDAQVYRLSDWRTAADEINYRRFFDINELAAVCMETEGVFEASHRLVFELLVRGDLDGLRIDHVDGLYNPAEYLWRLQWGYLRALGRELHERLGQDQAQGDPCQAATDSPSGQAPWQTVEPLVLRALWPEIGGPDPAQLFPTLAFPAEPGEAGEAAASADAAAGREVAPAVRPPLYIVVEKILGPSEPLPTDWPVAGTTGYDFLNYLGGALVSRPGLKQLRSNYRSFVKERLEFQEAAYEGKMLILRVAMSSELQMLAHRLNRISERHRRFRDLTLNNLRVALREILASFPIYRTYISQGGISERDRRFVQWAVALAKRANPARSAAAFDFIRDVLLLEQPPGLDEAGRRERELFVGRFQQVTSPVMAKGVEDTAFYRYLPLTSLNEVGADLAKPPAAAECFHRENALRRARYPQSLLATTTHDTKRSEDVRARISVLSEIPQVWRAAVNRWKRFNRRHRADLDGRPAPVRNDEYLLYQTLVGVWPVTPPDQHELQELRERLLRYMEKATREAKSRTSWINPDAAYEAGLRQFVTKVLEDHPKNRFLPDFGAFHEQILDFGLYSALSQVTLKLMSPGIPDIYQGQELWDFSLVDPDNRRPVNFACRRELLAELREATATREGQAALVRRLGLAPRDPCLKLYVTWRLLEFRRTHRELFDGGEYVPLSAHGTAAEHVCAFAWRTPAGQERGPQTAVVVVPRLLAQLMHPATQSGIRPAPLGAAVWHDTRLDVSGLHSTEAVNVLTGQRCGWNRSGLLVGDALADFPVAVLRGQQGRAPGS
ncbi:MAG: malto-oligosyltrehalose synthase [Pirellulaceae bacterium]|nr:malto-oligosyltrehalose synthase [Pirellulaceae bacterium]